MFLSRSAGVDLPLLQSGEATTASGKRSTVLKNPDEPRQENEVFRDRLSRLSETVLRVSSSFALHIVLGEVVDRARGRWRAARSFAYPAAAVAPMAANKSRIRISRQRAASILEPTL